MDNTTKEAQTMLEFLQADNIANTFAFDTGTLMGYLGLTLWYLIFFLCWGGSLFILYLYFVRYNHKIVILRQLGKGGYQILFDRGRLFSPLDAPGLKKLKLFWMKEETPEISGALYGIHGRKPAIIFSEQGGVLIPATIAFGDQTSIDFNIEHTARLTWLQNQKKLMESWNVQKIWEKYGQVIIFSTAMGIVAFVLLITFHYQQQNIELLSNLGNNLVDKIDQLNRLAKPLG